MKITKSVLKQIIKEEINILLSENNFQVPNFPSKETSRQNSGYGINYYKLSNDQKHVIVMINDNENYYVEVYEVSPDGKYDNINVETTKGTGGHGKGISSGKYQNAMDLKQASKLFTKIVKKYNPDSSQLNLFNIQSHINDPRRKKETKTV